MTPATSDTGQPGHTYLGFDFGTHKIGIAVGQTLTRTASGLDTLRVKGTKLNWNQITQLIDTWQPRALVVGIPLDSRGEETEMSTKARKFGDKLSARYDLPVYWVNEYLSSAAARQVQAEEVNSRQAAHQGDKVAAKLILETFLSEQNQTTMEA